ncbi:hypothetical protein ACQPZP_10705 [Spirillospora sp. CA-142024]
MAVITTHRWSTEGPPGEGAAMVQMGMRDDPERVRQVAEVLLLAATPY